ncbi:MAG TPA: hypothetical protein VFB33_10320 [Candidatus Binataceae bacterium]|jgi:hypothetical protein|nr:hypothetical protein [Candidatus Binataceae bacterium]
MRIEDALRKVRLLRRVRLENGASPAEADNAARLANAIIERYALANGDTHPETASRRRLSWVYWQHLMADFGIKLRHFGKRGNASLGDGRLVFIRLDSGQWQVQRTSPSGWETIKSDHGVEALRAYLMQSGPRLYSLTRK